MVSPPFGRNNLSSTDNSILSIITAFVNIEPEIRCKAADFCIYLTFVKTKSCPKGQLLLYLLSAPMMILTIRLTAAAIA